MRNSWPGLESRPMWKVFQLAIFIAVVGSNIEYQWTPNGYLAAILGGLAAYLATVFLTWTFRGLSALRRGYQRLRLGPRQDRVY